LSERLTAAERLAGEVAELFQLGDPKKLFLLQWKLSDLGDAVESYLPFGAEELCYFRNRVSSCRELAEGGEWGAGKYEATEMHRKLRRLREAQEQQDALEQALQGR
jgi:hypothetical protein